jgi:5-methylcytosine-specific restriction enzyme subunit McrC
LRKLKTITVFEHQSIRTDGGAMGLSDEQLASLQNYYGSGSPYFSLIHKGVQFNEHVGIIQVGDTLIEVLPKADKFSDDKDTWRTLLVGMIKEVYNLDVRTTSSANLKLKPNALLDLYFELFIKELEYLLHAGLVKKYRKEEGNNTSLKGNLLFAKHLQKNSTHQERFYTTYTTYDVKHPIHQIVYKTILLLNKINTNTSLQSRIGSLLLNFPEMPDIKVSPSLFKKITFNRKTLSYKKAIEIAEMILLHYHPDISKGHNDILALMFDMNKLWEEFVYVSLKKHKPSHYGISAQTNKYFWMHDSGKKSSIKPDIVLSLTQDEVIVLDTKWKNLNGFNPTADDLRQLYVYHHYYQAKKVALIYPGRTNTINGKYFNTTAPNLSDKICSVLSLEENKDIKNWQKEIFNKIDNWAKENSF